MATGMPNKIVVAVVHSDAQALKPTNNHHLAVSIGRKNNYALCYCS